MERASWNAEGQKQQSPHRVDFLGASFGGPG